MTDVTSKFIFSTVLKLAIEEAKKSTHKHKIGAVIFKGKRIVATAHNKVCSNSVPNKFKNWFESLHAECAAIIKAKRDLKNFDILVVRINNNNDLLLAKPCQFCREFIEYVAIKNVYYSFNNRIFNINSNRSRPLL